MRSKAYRSVAVKGVLMSELLQGRDGQDRADLPHCPLRPNRERLGEFRGSADLVLA